MNLNIKIAIITLVAFAGMVVFLGSIFIPQIDFWQGFLGMWVLWGITAVLSIIFFVPKSLPHKEQVFGTPKYNPPPPLQNNEKGIPGENEQSSRVCPACGTPVPTGANYCSACGATI